MTHRWDRELSQDEQISLAFARVVLQRPPWVLVDDTFGSLDDETLERVMDVFAQELERTASSISAGRRKRATRSSRASCIWWKAPPTFKIVGDAAASHDRTVHKGGCADREGVVLCGAAVVVSVLGCGAEF